MRGRGKSIVQRVRELMAESTTKVSIGRGMTFGGGGPKVREGKCPIHRGRDSWSASGFVGGFINA